MKINAEVMFKVITKGKENIENFPLESTVGTKKMIKDFHVKAVNERNNYVISQMEMFRDCKQNILEILKKRLAEGTPKDNQKTFDKEKSKLELLEEIIKYTNGNNDSIDKLGITEIICEIDEKENVDLTKVNNLLLEIFKILKEASIEVSASSFDYSMFTRIYGEKFLENMGLADFQNQMKLVFESIYWECPKLITHLKLNMLYLVNRYNKELDIFCEAKRNNLLNISKVTKDNYLENYNSTYESFKQKLRQDSFINVNKFLNKELNINDYLLVSPIRNSSFNKFVKGKSFSDLSSEEQKDFYLQINNLNETLEELDNYYYFDTIILDVIKRYKAKETYKGIYELKSKEVSKEDKVRNNLYKEYIKASKKNLFGKSNLDKANIIKVKMNEQITKLDTLYDELNEAKINEVIATSLNDGSTLYDIILLTNSFYIYLKPILNINFQGIEITSLLKKYFAFTYNPGVDFMKKINIFSDYNIADIIYEKYKLLDIELNREELEKDNLKKLKISTNMIRQIYYINNGSVGIDDIKIMCDIKNLELD